MLNSWWMEICVYWTMFFLVSTSVEFVLISEALTEFCAEFDCFSQDLTEMLLRLSSLYLPALCIMVSRDREQPAAPVWTDKRSVAQTSNVNADSFRFRFVCPALVNRSWWERGLFIPLIKLRHNLSLTECALRWRQGMGLSTKSVEFMNARTNQRHSDESLLKQTVSSLRALADWIHYFRLICPLEACFLQVNDALLYHPKETQNHFHRLFH